MSSATVMLMQDQNVWIAGLSCIAQADVLQMLIMLQAMLRESTNMVVNSSERELSVLL